MLPRSRPRKEPKNQKRQDYIKTSRDGTREVRLTEVGPHERAVSPISTTLMYPLYPRGSFTLSWTLSSESFSTFPHGTYLLSVSQSYLALDGVSHLFRLYSQTTRLSRERLEKFSLFRSNGPNTLYGQCFIKQFGLPSEEPFLALSHTWHPYERLTRPRERNAHLRGYTLSFSPFTRRYSRNLFWFLFLRIMICLSFAGNLSRNEDGSVI